MGWIQQQWLANAIMSFDDAQSDEYKTENEDVLG
jgi:hypothetical protein